MILRNLWIESFRHFSTPVHFGPFHDGINLICGANATGKSTFQRALTHVLFDRPDSKSRDFSQLVPWSCDVVPTIRLEFEHDGTVYQIEKKFASDGTARLSRECDGELVLWKEGQAATDWLRQCWGASAAQRGLTRLEHWGLGQLSIIEQGDLAVHSSLSSSTHDWLREAAVQLLVGRHADRIEHEIDAQYLQFFTPTGQPKKNSPSRELAQKQKLLKERYENLVRQQQSIAETEAELRAKQSQQAALLHTRNSLTQTLQSAAQITTSAALLAHQRTELLDQTNAAQTRLRKLHDDRSLQLKNSERITRTERNLTLDREELKKRQSKLTQCQFDLDANALAVQENQLRIAQLDADLLAAQTSLRKKQQLEQIDQTVDRVREIDLRLQTLNLEQERLLPTPREVEALAQAIAQLETVGQQQPVHLEVAYFPSASTVDSQRETIRGLDELSFAVAGIQFEIKGQVLRSAQERQSATTIRTDFIQSWKSADPAYWQEQHQMRLRSRLEIEFLKQERWRLIETESLESLMVRRDSLKASLIAQQVSDQMLHQGAREKTRLTETANALQNVKQRVEQELRSTQAAHQAVQVKINEQERELAHLTGVRASWPSDLATNIEQSERENELAVAKLTELDARLAQLTAATGESEAAQKQLLEVESTLKEIDRQEQRLLQRIDDLAEHFSEAALADASTSLLSVTRQQASAEHNERSLALLVQLFREERAKLQDQVVPTVTQEVKTTLQNIGYVVGRATEIDDIELDQNFLPRRLQVSNKSLAVDLADLSYGARDQVTLLGRLTLASLIADKQKFPALLDDPLVHIDALRRAQTMPFLQRMSEKLQLFVFTCHPEHYGALTEQAAVFHLSDEHVASVYPENKTSL